MADAYEDKIAEAIAGELNGTSRAWRTLFVAEAVTAARTRMPWATAPNTLQKLQVWVVPLTIDQNTSGARTHRVSRGSRIFDYGVSIDFQRQIDPTSASVDTTLKALSYMAEQIHDFFDDGHELTGLANWICLKADRKDVFNEPLMYASKIWETLIEVNVRGYRS